MLVPTCDIGRFDQLIEAREGLEQDVLAEKLSSAAILQYYKSILQGLSRSTQESSFWRDEEVFALLSERLGEMRSLAEDWDSYGAPVPARATIASAKQALEK